MVTAPVPTATVGTGVFLYAETPCPATVHQNKKEKNNGRRKKDPVQDLSGRK
jgi:hypothetical protein